MTDARTQVDSAIATFAGEFSSATATILPEGAGTALRALDPAGLELGELLGEGGMAVVHRATQTTLKRDVAVKRLRADARTDRSTRRLLQEAWTTGALEHPNIVPVYDIQSDDEGAPMVVLKRIEGESLGQRLADAPSADLEADLRVLMGVCRATHFAHRRGFVHRDIKPDNVMIGEFGEVYLLDWGISVAMEEDSGGRFALASEVEGLAGTPAYMAPEMVATFSPRIGPWTDVFLIGATLYEIVTGRPPNEGESLAALLHSALGLPSSFADSEPELWRICRRAMDPDPSARFESAEQLRLALVGFVEHRGARRLAERAERSFEAMRVAIATGDEAGADAAFAESRFGFRAALETWPQFDDASRRLAECEWTMARAELAAGRPAAADRLLTSSINPPAELRRAIDEALEAKRRENSKLERWRADVDEATGRPTRTAVSALLGVVWVFGPLLRSSLVAANPLGVFGQYAIATVFVVGVFYWARDSLKRSKINRGLVIVVLAVHAADLVLASIAAIHGRSLLWVEEILPLIWFTGACAGTWMISWQFWPTAIGMGVLCFAVPAFPEWRHVMASAANALLLLNTLWVNLSAPRPFDRPTRSESV